MRLSLTIVLILVIFSVISQNKLTQLTFGNTPSYFDSLDVSGEVLKENKLLNQHLVDLVEVYTVDSTYKRKFERHRVFGGGVIRMLGFRWLSVDKTREKVVGWVNKHYTREGIKDHFTEYDVNYDIIPELPEYVDLAVHAYQRQFNMKKSKKGKYKGQEPYIQPMEGSDYTKYRFHCELTPHADYRAALNTLFYPVHNNNRLDVHPNFEDEHPVLGMYGPLVLDCNHSCHPEIHPYEWIWWLDNTEIRNNTTTWWLGFMRDVSNRFKHWSKAPRTGAISIPFSFPMFAQDWTIHVNHQLFNGFDQEAYETLDLPNQHFFDSLETVFNLEANGVSEGQIKVVSNTAIPYKAISYHFSDLNIDVQKGLITGYFHLAMSVNDVYTASVSTSYNDDNQADVSYLSNLMTGSYTSELQAAEDSDFYNISLHMYPIWEHENNGKWLYVEQALNTRQEAPYRQRIYHLKKLDEQTYSSSVYLLPDANAAIGKWQETKFFNRWSPEDLTEKEGCAVILRRNRNNEFVGATVADNCTSNLYGATYAVSEVAITYDKIYSWDRGYDAKDVQVWGAEKGGYIFVKQPK